MLGQGFDAQLWMRDPASAKTTVLPRGPLRVVPMTAPLVSVHELYKFFDTSEGAAPVLKGVTFDVEPGEFVCVMGPSGLARPRCCTSSDWIRPAAERSSWLART